MKLYLQYGDWCDKDGRTIICGSGAARKLGLAGFIEAKGQIRKRKAPGFTRARYVEWKNTGVGDVGARNLPGVRGGLAG